MDNREGGASLVEYALLVVAIALGLVASVDLLARGVNDDFCDAGGQIGLEDGDVDYVWSPHERRCVPVLSSDGDFG